MIRSIKSKALKRFWQRGQAHAVSADHRAKVRRILDLLAEAETEEDMNIPGFRLHQLSGDLLGFWSVRVSANWRMVFRMEDGNAYDVDLLDYH